MSGGDHIHTGTVVGKLEGERGITMGFVDLLRENYVEQDLSRGIYFTQDWASMPGVMAVASGGILRSAHARTQKSSVMTRAAIWWWYARAPLTRLVQLPTGGSGSLY